MSATISNRVAHFMSSNTARLTLFVTLALMTGLIAHAKSTLEHATTGTKSGTGQSMVLAAEPPQIEVVFVLDTTGSMSGLIEGAKQKIWSIVNQMADANVTPDIRVGLIGFRDRGDV